MKLVASAPHPAALNMLSCNARERGVWRTRLVIGVLAAVVFVLCLVAGRVWLRSI